MFKLHEAAPEVMRQALEEKISLAPAFLKHATVVRNVSGFESRVNWPELHKSEDSTGLRIIGVSSCKSASLKVELDRTGLPLLTEGTQKAVRPASVDPSPPTEPPTNPYPIPNTPLIAFPCLSRH